MTRISKIAEQNRAYAAGFEEFLSLIPRAVGYEAGAAAMDAVLEYDTRNYFWGDVESKGGSDMPHDSSNAAWNWRIATGNNLPAAVDATGQGNEVGHHYDKRSGGNPDEAGFIYQPEFGAIQHTVKERYEQDIEKKLKEHLFKKATSVSGYNFKLANSIDDIDSEYARNANLEKVKEKAMARAISGALEGDLLWRQYSRGSKSGPNLAGFRRALP